MGLIFITAVLIFVFIYFKNAPERKKLKTASQNELITICTELERDPNNVDLLVKKAALVATLQGNEQGFRVLDDALLSIPDSGVLYYYRGWLLTQDNEHLPREAYGFYAKAIELGGLDPYELAYAYSMKGQIGHNYNIQGAMDDLKKAKEMGSASAAQYIKDWRLKC